MKLTDVLEVVEIVATVRCSDDAELRTVQNEWARPSQVRSLSAPLPDLADRDTLVGLVHLR